MFRRTFTPEEEEMVEERSGLQHHGEKGQIPWTERWKMSKRFAGTVSCLNQAVTNSDIMVTLWPEGNAPINMIIDTCFNTLYPIHAKLCELLGEEFGRVVVGESGKASFEPPLDAFEYSCEVNVVDEVEDGVTFKRVKKTLDTSWLDWLMNGHVIQVRKKPAINT